MGHRRLAKLLSEQWRLTLGPGGSIAIFMGTSMEPRVDRGCKMTALAEDSQHHLVPVLSL